MTASQHVITIDGLAASGKSSAAKGLAQRLGVAYVSSGLLYRALTWLALDEQLDVHDAHALLSAAAVRPVQLTPYADKDNKVCIEAKDISNLLETDAVDKNVSAVAKHPQVRTWVNQHLQMLTGNFVIDGRDMGTVVFPNARAKFYLHAAPEVRARRRLGERAGDLAELTAAIIERDQRDQAQSVPAEDAIHIHTDELTLEQVIDSLEHHLTPNPAINSVTG
ncbi:MAG: (d)CMP kinase [Deinococcota bacterium]